MTTFKTVRKTVLAAAVMLALAPAALAQGPACRLDGLTDKQLKDLPKAKPDLSALTGVVLGRQTVDEAVTTIEDSKSTPAMVDAARAKVTAARDLCVSALVSKQNVTGNLYAHACVALADYAQGRNESVKCRVDWIEFFGNQVKAGDKDRIRPLLGDAWEAKAKVQRAQLDEGGAQISYEKADAYQRTTTRLYNLAKLYEKNQITAPKAISTYRDLSERPDIGERKYDVLRSWALLVSDDANTSMAGKRERWDALRKQWSTPEANLRYAETFLKDNLGGVPDQAVTDALAAATAGSANNDDAVQSNARSFAWYYRAVFAARSAINRESWKTVAQYAGDGSAAPRATRLKCLSETASGGGGSSSGVTACPTAASTAEQHFLRGAMTLRASQFLPPACTPQLRQQGRACTENYSARWLELVSQAKQSFSNGRDLSNDKDTLDWLEQGDLNSPRLRDLLKAGETIAQDWQTTRPGFASCKTFPTPADLEGKARDVFGKLDLLKCAHS